MQANARIQKPSFPTHFSQEGEDVKINLFAIGDQMRDYDIKRLDPLRDYYGDRIEIRELGTKIFLTIKERVSSRKDIDAAAERLGERFSEHTGLTVTMW